MRHSDEARVNVAIHDSFLILSRFNMNKIKDQKSYLDTLIFGLSCLKHFCLFLVPTSVRLCGTLQLKALAAVDGYADCDTPSVPADDPLLIYPHMEDQYLQAKQLKISKSKKGHPH